MNVIVDPIPGSDAISILPSCSSATFCMTMKIKFFIGSLMELRVSLLIYTNRRSYLLRENYTFR